MNFFEHQHTARKRSGLLVLLFSVSVVCITGAVYFLCLGVFAYMSARSEEGGVSVSLFEPAALAGSFVLVALLVGGGSLYKLNQLRSGGKVIAMQLGGRRISGDTRDPLERRVLNVVEEMAIASGVPVPPVFVMDRELGINAFAAGYKPDSAVIGVTRGSLELLSRSQLQGVMAHEFSHILNGDMRLNIRLVGVLHGIMLIGLAGSLIMRSALYSSAFSSRSNRDNGGGALAIVLFGVVLAIIGGIGMFFGAWIQSAVSRQREYLADASAVQFTRDKETITGALRTIGGHAGKAHVKSPIAGEMAHMFFGSAVTSSMHNIFASHPPLHKRIKRVDPQWDGTYLEPVPQSKEAKEELTRIKKRSAAERLGDLLPGVLGDAALGGGGPAGAGVPEIPGVPGGAVGVVITGGLALELMGELGPQQVAHARTLIEQVPDEIRKACAEPFSARAVVFGLLLHAEGPERSEQIERLREHADEGTVRELARLLPAFDAFEPDLRLTVLDMAAPALSGMTKEQAQVFIENCKALAEADEKIEYFEWSLLQLVERRLGSLLGKSDERRTNYYALNKLAGPVSLVLSALAEAGHDDASDAEAAFAHAARPLRMPQLRYQADVHERLHELGGALDVLSTIAPRPMRQLVQACAASIAADKAIQPAEAELFRAIAEVLGVPAPPLLAGQRLG